MIGEERRQAVAARLVQMAAGAIGLLRVIEQSIAAHLGIAQARLALEPVIELAGVGVEARLLDLIAPDREHRFLDQKLGIAEHARAKQFDKKFRSEEHTS